MNWINACLLATPFIVTALLVQAYRIARKTKNQGGRA
jgi:hypothetical protein